MSKATTKSSAWSSLTAMQKKIIKEVVDEQVRAYKQAAYQYSNYTGNNTRSLLSKDFGELEADFDLKQSYQRAHANLKSK